MSKYNEGAGVLLADLNIEVVDKWFTRFPRLETFICAGTISLKTARDILMVDRYEMYDIYLELLEAQALYAAGGSCFRASPQLKAYVAKRRAEHGKRAESEKLD